MPRQATPIESAETTSSGSAASDESGAVCYRCQHRVEVRGVNQIVCLAHLAVFNSTGDTDSACAEFEARTPPPTR